MDDKNEMLSRNDASQEEKEPFVPSPKWKRVFAWILFAIVTIGIVLWLLNIAYPGMQWIKTIKTIRSLL